VADAIPGQFPRVRRGKDEVSLEAGVDDLADDILVGEANDKTVFRRVAAKIFRVFHTYFCDFGTHYLFFAWVTSLLRA
jgi:hypothetical protein